MGTDDNGSEYVSVTEAARILGCHRRTILRAIRARALPFKRLGPRGWIKVLRSALTAVPT